MQQSSDEPFAYLCVLVRVWRARHGDKWVWRGTLENVHTRERKNFYGLAALAKLLEIEAAAATRDKASPMKSPGAGALTKGERPDARNRRI